MTFATINKVRTGSISKSISNSQKSLAAEKTQRKVKSLNSHGKTTLGEPSEISKIQETE